MPRLSEYRRTLIKAVIFTVASLIFWSGFSYMLFTLLQEFKDVAGVWVCVAILSDVIILIGAIKTTQESAYSWSRFKHQRYMKSLTTKP